MMYTMHDGTEVSTDSFTPATYAVALVRTEYHKQLALDCGYIENTSIPNYMIKPLTEYDNSDDMIADVNDWNITGITSYIVY